MRDLNIDFMDLYKRVDKFIRDAYSSSDGVSEYIRKMELNRFKGQRYVSTWAKDYDMLKHIRWIRNQLSHEVGYDSDICEENDYDYLNAFHQRLFSSDDPLAVMTRQEQAEIQCRSVEEKRRQAEVRRRQQMQEESQRKEVEKNPITKKKPSLLDRIISFFRGR